MILLLLVALTGCLAGPAFAGDSAAWGGLTGGSVALQMNTFDFETGLLEYQVFEPCFVRIRYGVFEGPCLGTIENWSFREPGVYHAAFPTDSLPFLEQKKLIAAPLALSFSPDANLIEPAPLMLSSGNRFGEAPREIDIVQCAQTADRQSARDASLILSLTSVEDDPELNGQYLLSIDLDGSRRRQFSAERFKLTVYANDIPICQFWDGHLPCTILIDPAVIGYPEGILAVNAYTFFDRLAVAYLPYSFTINPKEIRKSDGGTP